MNTNDPYEMLSLIRDHFKKLQYISYMSTDINGQHILLIKRQGKDITRKEIEHRWNNSLRFKAYSIKQQYKDHIHPHDYVTVIYRP